MENNKYYIPIVAVAKFFHKMNDEKIIRNAFPSDV